MAGFCISSLLFSDAVEILGTNCIYLQEIYFRKKEVSSISIIINCVLTLLYKNSLNVIGFVWHIKFTSHTEMLLEFGYCDSQLFSLALLMLSCTASAVLSLSFRNPEGLSESYSSIVIWESFYSLDNM